jgi:hypothetical protein
VSFVDCTVIVNLALQVEYVLADTEAGPGTEPAVQERLNAHSEVVYLNKLQGGDVVQVVPAVCGNAAVRDVARTAESLTRNAERMVVVRTQLVPQ